MEVDQLREVKRHNLRWSRELTEDGNSRGLEGCPRRQWMDRLRTINKFTRTHYREGVFPNPIPIPTSPIGMI